MNSKVIAIPALSLLLGGCALLNDPYYYSYRRSATPFSRPCISVRPGCRPSVSRCQTFGRSSSYGNAWKWYENAAKAEINLYKSAAKAQMKAYKSAAKWAKWW